MYNGVIMSQLIWQGLSYVFGKATWLKTVLNLLVWDVEPRRTKFVLPNNLSSNLFWTNMHSGENEKIPEICSDTHQWVDQ